MKIGQRFSDWYLGNNETEKEPPKGGLKRVFYLIVNYSGKIILINIIFILSCLPIFTIPAAITALNKYILKVFRIGYGFSLSDYFTEFKNGILKCLPLGIMVGAMDFYAYYLLSLANNFTQPYQKSVITGIGIAFLFIGILSGSYIFMLSAMLELPNKHIIKNSFILIILEWKTSILIFLSILFTDFLILLFIPYSILLILFGFIVWQQLLVCSLINPIVNRRIIEPYEKSIENKDIN